MVPTLYVVGPVRLYGLYNLTTNRRIHFDVRIADGEDIQVDLRTGLVVSNQRGILRGTILPGSDVARWYLLPGQNRVAVWGVGHDTAKTKFILRWQTMHISADGAL